MLQPIDGFVYRGPADNADGIAELFRPVARQKGHGCSEDCSIIFVVKVASAQRHMVISANIHESIAKASMRVNTTAAWRVRAFMPLTPPPRRWPASGGAAASR